jgi:DNA-binding CsgD family transcriptional regulator/tetratricopeptide (TPR) repeat protein
MIDMRAGISSLRFVGRGDELERLVSAFKSAAADERATAVMLGGEAGVGKTRLVAELAVRVREAEGLVLMGSCLDLTNSALPFGPVIQALRSLPRALGRATLAAVIGPAGEVLERLVPELQSHTAGENLSVGALFEHLLGVFERLGDRVPTLLVLEDLHWADHSTRDLVVYLARNLQDGRVMLVGTYRSDDLHRRHPLRAVIAELDRSGSAQRLELDRFDRGELREMIASILACDPSVDLIDMVFERSEGNAFFAEELVAARGTAEQIPMSLRDTMLARIDALSEGAQQLLRIVSVIGRRADHRLVSALGDTPQAELSLGVRDATEHQVLVVEPDGAAYRFRHALVREAVYDDLLPGERVRLHSRLAELLTAHPEWCEGGPAAVAGELAGHWYAAHDAPRALKAMLDAAGDAERMYAYPEALAYVERALELWPQVPDAAELCGIRHIDVVQYAAIQADLAGSAERAVEFIATALAEVDEDADPVMAGLLHERLARYLRGMGHPADEILRHVDIAARLVSESHIEARARILATRGQQLMLAGRSAEAVEPCEQALQLAQQAGAVAISSHARNTLGISLTVLGDTEGGLQHLRRSREDALEVRAWDDVTRAYTNEASALTSMARHQESLAVALEGVDIARRHGLGRQFGACLRPAVCEDLWVLGRWDEIEHQLREIDATDPTGVNAWQTAEIWAEWHAGRGDFDSAHAHLDRLRSLLGTHADAQWQVELANLEVEIALWQGDLATAIECAQRGMNEEFESPQCTDTHGPLALPLNAIAAAAQLATHGGPRERDAQPNGLVHAKEFVAQFDDWVARERWGRGRPGDLATAAKQIAAELARAAGDGDADDWSELADEWLAFGMRPRVAYARWREAELRLAMGDRAGAGAAALAAYQIADSVGWQWVRDGVGDLARRARLEIAPKPRPTPGPAEKLGLTSREIEVLGLVAAGRTNRQIAESLFISTKTASAHVSNLLMKLGVANRSEAGAAARELRLA